MPHGHYWEMCYKPEENAPEEKGLLSELVTSTGFCGRRIESPDEKPVTIKLRKATARKSFEDCDFVLKVRDSDLTNCTFTRCRFNGSHWENVKFSNCTFDHCHFAETAFVRCYFLRNCTFRAISASAEKLRMEETAISPSAFLSAIQTNLEFLEDGSQVPYQSHRLIGTKEKIAKMIFQSTRSESDMDYFFDAQKQLAIHSLNQNVERHRYFDDERFETVKPNRYYLVFSVPARIEKAIILMSGWLTDWGRSLLRALIFFAVVVLVFTGVYMTKSVQAGTTQMDIHDFGKMVSQISSFAVKSVEITLVAGYTAHVNNTISLPDRATALLNLILGLYWYSLVIPVLSRRTLR